LGIKNIKFKQGDFKSLNYPNNYFDSVVLNMGTIGDFKDKEGILKEFLRVGKKVYFDFYPPIKKGLMKRKKMYEEEEWKNVKIKDEAVVSDDGLYSESISKEEIKKIVDKLRAKVSFYDFCDFSTMAEVTKS
jgi:SAM-dependent methyltransferase